MNRPNERGFTLVELLIVVVIIGILATIAIPRLQVTRFRAYRSAAISDLKVVANQQEIFHLSNFQYTTSLADLDFTSSEGVTVAINEASMDGWSATSTHAGVEGEQCGIYYGSAAAAGGSPANTPGVVSCTF